MVSPESDRKAVATVNRLLAGYVHAIRRLEEAIEARDPAAAFRAVFEALNWASSIDDRIRGEWAPEGQPLDWAWRERVTGAELMPGVRFVRNRVHHHWADAIYLDDTGLTFPLTFPARFETWRWRLGKDLPPGNDDHGEDVYAAHLEGQAVEGTLLRLGLAFEQVGHFLVPHHSDRDGSVNK